MLPGMPTRSHGPLPTLLQLAVGICLTLGAGLPSTASEEAEATPRLGFLVNTRLLDESDSPGLGTGTALVRIDLDWEEVERTPGAYDWAAQEKTVDALVDAGRTVVLAIGGTNPLYLPEGGLPSPEVGESLQAWVAYVRGAVQQFGDRVAFFQVGDQVGQDPDLEARLEALVIKQASLVVRAEARARNRLYHVVQPALEAGDIEHQRSLWSHDVAAYVDIVPVLLHAEAAEAVPLLSSESLKHPPAVEIWAYAEPERTPQPSEAAVRALADGASAAFFRLPLASREAASLVAWGLILDALLQDGYAPAPLGGLRFDGQRGEVLGRFFSERGFQSLVAYKAGAGAETQPLRLLVDAAVVREVRAIDAAGSLRVDRPSTSRSTASTSGSGAANWNGSNSSTSSTGTRSSGRSSHGFP